MGPGIAPTSEELREVRALLLLKEGSGLGDGGIRKLVGSLGSGVRALRAQGHQMELLASSTGVDPVLGWMEEGFGVLPMTSSRYPRSLTDLTDPPPVIFLKGKQELLSLPAVAIVGSRRATGTGRRAAETMGRILAGAGITVVSGMALGLDGAAHRGALLGGGRTVAVLGSGFKKVYPASHRRLFHEIGEAGLLVSEFLPHEAALPYHFPKRNRIIAALAQAVVVVEAGRKSGALITVDHGLDLGKDILATPGSVENPQSLGSNTLLRDGARVLIDPARVLEDLEEIGFDFRGSGGQDPVLTGPGLEIPSELDSLWKTLGSEPVSVEEVAANAAVPLADALSGLFALELGGWVRQCPGMRFQRC